MWGFSGLVPKICHLNSSPFSTFISTSSTSTRTGDVVLIGQEGQLHLGKDFTCIMPHHTTCSFSCHYWLSPKRTFVTCLCPALRSFSTPVNKHVAPFHIDLQGRKADTQYFIFNALPSNMHPRYTRNQYTSNIYGHFPLSMIECSRLRRRQLLNRYPQEKNSTIVNWFYQAHKLLWAIERQRSVCNLFL